LTLNVPYKGASELIAALDQSDLSPAIKDEVRRNLAAYQRDFFAWMEGALTVGNEQKAMSEAYAAIESALDTTLNYISQANASAEDENQNSRADIKFKLLIAMLLIAIAVSALSFWIARSITNPIRALTAGMRELANGNFDVVLFGLGRKDEIGDIAGAIETFKVKAAERAQIEAGEKAEQDKKAAAEREVAMQKMASEFEAAVGGIVQAAVAGDFTQRVDLNGKTGLVLNIGTALNSLCDNTARALDDLIKMLNALADGDLTPRITAEYQGNFAILKDNANKTAERIGATIGEIKQSAREVTNASAEISTSTTDLSQRTEEQAASLEETSASMEEISATVKKNAENAQ
jgi:methyl-accepting chemotaxis protein